MLHNGKLIAFMVINIEKLNVIRFKIFIKNIFM